MRGALKRENEFLALSDVALRAVAGPNSRHAALIEDAFHVLMETPGGGLSVAGHAKDRAGAKHAVQIIAGRADEGLEISEADVRVAIAASRTRDAKGQASALPVGRRGGIAPKTA